MKRVLAAVLTMLALAACASPLAKVETPQQALDAPRSAPASSSRQVRSRGQRQDDIPRSWHATRQSGAAAGSISLDMTGTGEAQFPIATTP